MLRLLLQFSACWVLGLFGGAVSLVLLAMSGLREDAALGAALAAKIARLFPRQGLVGCR